MSFTFETGDESNSTQPGSHILAGYLTLQKGTETGTGYVIAQALEGAAPNFETLKEKTPEHQTYSLEKGKPQWIPVLNLEPETSYTMYVGVEYANGKTQMETLLATTAATGHDSWKIYMREDGGKYYSREIQVYRGQTIVLPMIVNINSSLPKWIALDYYENGTNLYLSSGFVSIEQDEFEHIVLGEDLPFPNDGKQYHFQIKEITTQLAGELAMLIPDINPASVLYTLVMLD